jgi:hypothetical protein
MYIAYTLYQMAFIAVRCTCRRPFVSKLYEYLAAVERLAKRNLKPV